MNQFIAAKLQNLSRHFIKLCHFLLLFSNAGRSYRDVPSCCCSAVLFCNKEEGQFSAAYISKHVPGGTQPVFPRGSLQKPVLSHVMCGAVHADLLDVKENGNQIHIPKNKKRLDCTMPLKKSYELRTEQRDGHSD